MRRIILSRPETQSKLLGRGSNQYRTRRRIKLGAYGGAYSFIAIAFLATSIFGLELGDHLFKYPDVKIISPLAKGPIRAYAEIKPTQTPTPSEHSEIRAYIEETFGNDSDKAFKLLSCENKALNPDAVNTAGNYPEGSRDIGIFQINEYWQKIQGKFLFNWKINVEIAHQLFEENGKSFKMWTCGRKLGV